MHLLPFFFFFFVVIRLDQYIWKAKTSPLYSWIFVLILTRTPIFFFKWSRIWYQVIYIQNLTIHKMWFIERQLDDVDEDVFGICVCSKAPRCTLMKSWSILSSYICLWRPEGHRRTSIVTITWFLWQPYIKIFTYTYILLELPLFGYVVLNEYFMNWEYGSLWSINMEIWGIDQFIDVHIFQILT